MTRREWIGLEILALLAFTALRWFLNMAPDGLYSVEPTYSDQPPIVLPLRESDLVGTYRVANSDDAIVLAANNTFTYLHSKKTALDEGPWRFSNNCVVFPLIKMTLYPRVAGGRKFLVKQEDLPRYMHDAEIGHVANQGFFEFGPDDPK